MLTSRTCHACGKPMPVRRTHGPCNACLMNSVARETVDPGLAVDGYDIFGSIGEGGMAEVFYARQLHPVRREVAIKVIKPGMDSRQLIARFEGERQALALMDHPHIARVFDAGTTRSGRPYFAMEFVDGTVITDWGKSSSVKLRDKLQMFVDVCRAVQHAHLKGIIHRDLKPSNILVAQQDGRPVPRVIDFGVAKALGARLDHGDEMTQTGQVVGTPLYMSPEQSANVRDLDTRTDVYSLGVVLYQMLTGVTPFENERHSSTSSILQAVREDEPAAPSVRCARDGNTILARLLQGDLDAILLHALEKDRDLRYSSPEALASDVEAYLNDQPILARPPSSVYRMRKFARRNRVLMIASTMVLASMIVGTGASLWLARQARIERDIARAEQRKSLRIVQVLEDLFSSADPTKAGKDVRVVEVLAGAERKAEANLRNEPEVLDAVMSTLATTHFHLSEFDSAERIWRAILQRNALRGPMKKDSATALHAEIANTLNGKGRYQEAASLMEPFVRHIEDIPDAGKKANALIAYGTSLVYVGRELEAQPSLLRAIEIASKQFGDPNKYSAMGLSVLGDLSTHIGVTSNRIEYYSRAIEQFEALPGRDIDVSTLVLNLATAYRDNEEYERALPLLERGLQMKRELYGTNTSEAASALVTYASINLSIYNEQLETNRLIQAEIQVEEAMKILANPAIDGSGLLPWAFRTKGKLHRAQKRYREAGEATLAAMQLIAQNQSTNSFAYAEVLGEYGRTLVRQERYPEARATLEQFVAVSQERFKSDTFYITNGLNHLAQVYEKLGELALQSNALQKAAFWTTNAGSAKPISK